MKYRETGNFNIQILHIITLFMKAELRLWVSGLFYFVFSVFGNTRK